MNYPDVDTWKRESEEDAYFYSDGKNLVINLDKVIPNSMKKLRRRRDDEVFKFMRTFIVERKLFYKRTDLIAQYLDYFTEFFDEDKELIIIYLNMKEVIDSTIKQLTIPEYMRMLFIQELRIC